MVVVYALRPNVLPPPTPFSLIVTQLLAAVNLPRDKNSWKHLVAFFPGRVPRHTQRLQQIPLRGAADWQMWDPDWDGAMSRLSLLMSLQER